MHPLQELILFSVSVAFVILEKMNTYLAGTVLFRGINFHGNYFFAIWCQAQKLVENP